MGYLITFIANFALAYFLYDDPSYVKPLIQSFCVTLAVIAVDVIRKYRKKRD